jgi:hypothetical protein
VQAVVPWAGVVGIVGLAEIARSRQRGHAGRQLVQTAEAVGLASHAARRGRIVHLPDCGRAAEDLDVEEVAHAALDVPLDGRPPFDACVAVGRPRFGPCVAAGRLQFGLCVGPPRVYALPVQQQPASQLQYLASLLPLAAFALAVS